MLVSKAAKRYAEALHDLAGVEGCLDCVLRDMRAIDGAVADSPELARFLPDYTIGRPERLRALEALFKNGSHGLSWRFLLFLESKKRMALLRAICGAIQTLHDKSMGIVDVALTTALPVAERDMGVISSAIRNRLAGTMRLSKETDRGLIGGFVFRVGDTVYDYSVKGGLQALSRKLGNG